MSPQVDRVNVTLPSELRKEAVRVANERGLTLSTLLSILLAADLGMERPIVRQGRPPFTSLSQP